MLLKTYRSPPLSLTLADVRPVRQSAIEVGLGIWVALLIGFPAIVFRNIRPETINTLFIEPKSHMLVEVFCSFVAGLIACLIAAVAVRRQERALWLFATAFLAMSVLDALHAFTDPVAARELFVAYHTASIVTGGILITLGLIHQVIHGRQLRLSDLKWITFGLLFLGAIATLYRAILPHFMVAYEPLEIYRFSAPTHFIHGLSALLYGVSAVLLYKLYRSTGQILMLVVASFLVLFAQSALLFSFSNMWDFPWWLWHGVKVLFYLGILVSLAIGFLLALDATQRSHAMVVRANIRIKRSQRAIRKANRELHTRNRMVLEAIGALDIPHALDVVGHAVSEQVGFGSCELVLLVPEDRVAELARSPRFAGTRHPIRVAAESPAKAPAHGCSADLLWSDTDAGGARWVYFDLVAHGNRFGYLKFSGIESAALAASYRELSALASEAGPIIYNALLYLDWQLEGDFRAALLRVSTMLTSTLDLNTVLAAVCRESAALLEADGAAVWLPNQTGNSFSIAARWFSQNRDDSNEQVQAWCQDGKLCAQLLAEISGQYHPRAWVMTRDNTLVAPNSALDHDKAIALFPLVDEERLIGVMMLMREDLVPFSQVTLSKGELLAGQVRIAISNASSYRKMTEINQQLLLAEATKIRNERLAVLGQMAASVAHEVRNPLSAIANCVSVLKADCPPNTKTRTALEIIEDEVFRLDKLTRDFLAFGKPRPATRSPVAIDALLQKVCSALRHHIAREGLAIDVEDSVRNGGRVLMLDADAMEMVLWNLLLNATQAISAQGRVKVTLTVRPKHLFVAIADTGKGILVDERELIFEPFYSQRSHGAGLGLAIVRRFIQDWQGRLRIMSIPEQGTTFLLMIPISSAHGDNGAQRRSDYAYITR